MNLSSNPAENGKKLSEIGKNTDIVEALPSPANPPQPEIEIGGPAGPEPTRYGDWEVKGRCSDF